MNVPLEYVLLNRGVSTVEQFSCLKKGLTMIISDDLIKQIEDAFPLSRVKNVDDWDGTLRILGQASVVDWLKDKQQELNQRAMDGNNSQITIKQ